MLKALIIDIAVIAGFYLLGIMVTTRLLKRPTYFELLSLSFPLGAGLLTWILFILSWAFMPIRLSTILLVWLILISGFLLLKVIHQPVGGTVSPLTTEFDHHRQDVVLKVSVAVICVIFLTSVFLSIGGSYFSYDAISMWAPKGYGIALEESVWGAKLGSHDFAYPLNIHFIIGIFKIFSGDILPGSKVIFSLFFISLLFGVMGFALRRGVQPRLMVILLVVLATVPTLFRHSTIGYANLPMGVYLVLGVLWGIDGIFSENKSSQVLSGLLFGLTIWTIVEGGFFVIAAIIGLVGARFITRKGRIYPLHWFLPIVLIGGSWVIFYKLYGAQSSQAMGAVQKLWDSILQGQWRLSNIRLILGYTRRFIFYLDTWGLIFIILLVGWRYLQPKQNIYTFTLILVTLSTGALTLGLFYLRSFDIPGLYGLLERGLPRGFITPTVLFFIVVVLVSGDLVAALSVEDPPAER
jgi:hypothetical protein